MASAEIIFDNSANWLPVDFAEVSMARRAYRDGHNDYLLNGQQVRLRDMNELLAASGLSERTYTILGQGLVDASLALKADERRRLFEEAAGVGLYRVRREDALKRLENTQHNLERVQDIMAELEPRLKSLERQARRAIEYSRSQADLRVLLLDWYGYHWHRAQIELNETREVVRQQERRVNEARDVYTKAQEEYAAFRERLSGLRTQLNVWHRESAELHSQRKSVSRDLAVLDERRRALVASQSLLQSELERSINEEKLAHERFSEIDQEAASLQSEFDEAKSQSLRARRKLCKHVKLNVWQRMKSCKPHARRLHPFTRNMLKRKPASMNLPRALKSQKQKLDAIQRTIRSAEADTRKAEQVYENAKTQRVEAGEVVQGAIAEAESNRSEVEKLENERRVKLEERVARQAEYSRAQAQLDILIQAEQSLAGYAEGARFLLDAARQSRLSARGALSAALDVPAELEIAIAAALGDTLDAVLLKADQIDEALHLLESDEAGRVALLPLDGKVNHSLSQPNDADCIGVASSLVNVSDDLRVAVHLLLGNTLIVRDRNAARRLMGDIPTHARIVTLRGEVFRGDGLVVAGKSGSASTLSRPRQKRELTESLADLASHLEILNASITKLSEELNLAQRQQTASEEELRKARVEFDEAQSAEQKAAIDLETARRQWDWQRSQHDELQKDVSAAEADRERLAALASENEAKAGQAQESIRLLTKSVK